MGVTEGGLEGETAEVSIFQLTPPRCLLKGGMFSFNFPGVRWFEYFTGESTGFVYFYCLLKGGRDRRWCASPFSRDAVVFSTPCFCRSFIS